MTRQASSTAGNRGPTEDSGYKLPYSHIPMVRDLRDRTDDIVWRVRWGRDWLYVYLLLEFQSTIDPWMAVRIQTYLGLLYQDLIRTKQLSVAGLLPPVLPLVLYNGGPPWDAAR